MSFEITQNTTVAILGYGVEGQSVEKFLKDKCKSIAVFDEFKKEAQFKNKIENLDVYDVIFRSPGIHKDHPELIKAQNQGSIVTSATQLFFDLCLCKIIGVTGTKGKGTTCTLIYKILEEAGEDVYLGGNIGTSPLEFLEELKKDSIVVLELSSFQLHDLTKSPQIAVVLKTTSEHLDYHKDLEEYLSAKESIVRYQTDKDLAVLNSDYPYSERFSELTPAKKVFVSTKKEIPYKEVGLIGPHNLENILAAAAVCKSLNVPSEKIEKVVKEFKGLPHRLEFIREFNGIEFYNDSFSTTPETCIAAIQSFSKPLTIIAGGSEKNSDYTDLGKAICDQDNLKNVVLMGKTASEIESSINKAGKGPEIMHAKSYQEAFEKAYENADKDGVVVLSPASASFDMFKNYKHRGETFRKWVESL